MLASLFASTVDDAGKVAAITTAVGALLTFAGILVRQSLAATKMTSEQSDKWQDMVTAVERRAELAEKRADSCETRAAAAEHKAAAAEIKATAAEGRADLLEHQCDEIRFQLEALRQQVAAADVMPKREPPP